MTGPDDDLLADLDAGLLDPTRAREVRRAALADPRCAAVLDALAATRADLAAVPAPVAPPGLVAGWLAALETAAAVPHRHEDPGRDAVRGTEAPADPAPGNTSGRTASGVPGPGGARDRGARSAPAPGHRIRPGSRAPRLTTARRRGWVLLAAASALVVGVLVSRPGAPSDITRVELAGLARSTVGTTDLGVLADPARRAACLSAAGHSGAAVLGGRQVRLDGTPGVLLVLSTGELGRFRVIVVTPGCAVLADDVVGR